MKITKPEIKKQFERLLDNTTWYATQGAEQRWMKNRLEEMWRVLSRFTNEQVVFAVSSYLDSGDPTSPLPSAGHLKGIIISDPTRWLPEVPKERPNWGPLTPEQKAYYEAHRDEIDNMDVDGVFFQFTQKGKAF